MSNILFFKNSFFLFTVIKWNNLDKGITNSESFAVFKKSILQFIWPTPNRTFDCHNPIGIKLITRLRLGLSQLRVHKFKHNFLDCLIQFFAVAKTLKLLIITSFTAQFFQMKDQFFFNNIWSVYENVLSGSDSRISEMLLFGISSFNDTKDTSILTPFRMGGKKAPLPVFPL